MLLGRQAVLLGRKDYETLAASVSTSNAGTPVRKDLTQVTWFNCNEEGYYSKNCSRPRRVAS